MIVWKWLIITESSKLREKYNKIKEEAIEQKEVLQKVKEFFTKCVDECEKEKTELEELFKI